MFVCISLFLAAVANDFFMMAEHFSLVFEEISLLLINGVTILTAIFAAMLIELVPVPRLFRLK
jgi:hypothetical protein